MSRKEFSKKLGKKKENNKSNQMQIDKKKTSAQQYCKPPS
jgi:hypothetical protein